MNRVLGHEADINGLRKRAGIAPIQNLDIFDYAYNEGYVFVADEEGVLRAYVLATNDQQNNFIIEDLLVDPVYRGKGLGKFVLGKLASKMQAVKGGLSMAGAQRLVVGPQIASETTGLMEWLESRGFHKTGETDEKALLLPGQVLFNVPRDKLDEAKAKMPSDWNGYLEIVDSCHSADGWIEVFRRGNLVGTLVQSVTEVPQAHECKNNSQLWYQCNFEFASGVSERGVFTGEHFAVIAMLNHTTSKELA